MKKISANYFIRHLEVGALLETFLVMAVFALVGVRTFLYLLDYPKIATESIHVAHALWGGLLMLVGLLLAVVFINRESRFVGAAVGGLGFGIFIDQLGKFLTHDADYFFQPAFAIIYVLFLLLFYLFRAIEKSVPPTSQEYMINAVEILKDAMVHDLDVDERQKALALLRRADRDDEVVQKMTELIKSIEPREGSRKGMFTYIKILLREVYFRLVRNKYFNVVMVAFFSLSSLVALILSMSDGFRLSVWGWGMRLSALATIVFVVLGLWWLVRRNYRRGFEWLRFSVLFSLFFFQFFLFYFSPVVAFMGLLLNVFTLMILNYAITQESEGSSVRSASEPYKVFRRVVRMFIAVPLKN